MSSTSRRVDEDSRGSGPSSAVPEPLATADGEPLTAVSRALLGAVAAGVIALVAATFLPVLRISVDEGVVTSLDRSGWDEHGAALLALAVFAALMLAALLRGEGGDENGREAGSAAALAIALCGVAVIAIVIASDLPDVGEVGAVGTRLRSGEVGTGLGAYAETLGGVLLLAGGGGLVLRGGR